MEEKSLVKLLQEVQTELKAPKNQYNSFAKYHYRSQEDILEAVKPLLAKRGLALTLNDEIVQFGTRVYVKATATLYGEMDKSFKVEAYAREPEEKKGMDESQITGTASSYARKYALNGLFAIDDTEDSDAQGKLTGGKPAPIHINDPYIRVTPGDIRLEDIGNKVVTTPNITPKIKIKPGTTEFELGPTDIPDLYITKTTLCTNRNIRVETLAEAKALRISLDKVATYLKKRPEEVTEEDRQKCIATKKKALEAKK